MIAAEHGENIDPMKLLKLVYYAHGWSLALLNRPLIDEQVQAWKYGPVVASVYHAFKFFGEEPITELTAEFKDDGKAYTPVVPSNTDERKLLERVWERYGHFSGVQLSNMSHEADSPWSYAWRENTEGLRSYAIDNRQIERYFKMKAERQKRDERRRP